MFFLLIIGFLQEYYLDVWGWRWIFKRILIVSGRPPAVAVGSEANHIVGSSLTGFLTYFRRKYVDITMGSIMITGGGVGSILGVYLFKYLSMIGRLEAHNCCSLHIFFRDTRNLHA